MNDELANVEAGLDAAVGLLAPEGRLVVISYHSLEDALVKNDFKLNDKKGVYRIITKKPIVPTREEIVANVRARSAKLRIAQKL